MPDQYADLRSEEAMNARSAAVRKQFDAATRREKQAGSAKTVAIALLAIGLGWAVYNNGRLAGLDGTRKTVYTVLQPNGAFITSEKFSDVVTGPKYDNSVSNVLWTYIMSRECYGSLSFIREAYIAQAMSDERVNKTIRMQWNLANPQAPQHIYGEHGIIVQCAQVDPPMPIGDNGNEYLFRFRRWEDTGHTTQADIDAAPFYSVTLKFRTGIYPQGDPLRAWQDPATFNAPGVQIIEYSGAKPTSGNVTPRKQASN